MSQAVSNPAPGAISPASIPLSLYVHLPWCVRKCPYCDFNSHRAPDTLPEADYLQALTADLDFSLADCGDRPLHSIFIGGGTPSLFSAEAIASLLDMIRARLALEPDCEITLEANPGAADTARFAGYRQAGVNRLSLGLQSLNAAQLKNLGRIHDAGAACAAVAAARSAGFDNFNTDMMYALPNQSAAEAATDLDALIALGAPHISYYQLTLEPGTPFFHRPPPVPDNDGQWAIHEQAARQLTAAGYAQYEVSAWARPGHACRHNLNYWRFGDYLGIGAGAHGKVTHNDGRVLRTARQPMPRRYQMAAGSEAALAAVRPLSEQDLQFEYLLNALRLTDGFELADYEIRTGLPASTLAAALAPHDDMLEMDGQTVRCSAQGATHLDDLLVRLLPENSA